MLYHHHHHRLQEYLKLLVLHHGILLLIAPVWSTMESLQSREYQGKDFKSYVRKRMNLPRYWALHKNLMMQCIVHSPRHPSKFNHYMGSGSFEALTIVEDYKQLLKWMKLNLWYDNTFWLHHEDMIECCSVPFCIHFSIWLFIKGRFILDSIRCYDCIQGVLKCMMIHAIIMLHKQRLMTAQRH